jgi:hypothetical protein
MVVIVILLTLLLFKATVVFVPAPTPKEVLAEDS